MKEIKYVKVTTVAAAVAELAKGKAAVLAGGTDLVQGLKAMISPNAPDTLVNIKPIADLKKPIAEDSGMLKIGPLTTLSDIAASTLVQTKYTALAQAAGRAASPELRNYGTIGGNICQGVRCWYYRGEHNVFSCLRKNPQGLCYALIGDTRYHSIFGPVSGCIAVNPSDIAPALVALNANIVTSKPRTLAAQDFFATKLAPAGEGTTVLDANEIVTEIQVPTPAAGVKSAFVKFATRQSFDFPIVNCAAMIGGSTARICLNAVYNMPRRVTAAETAVSGKAIDNTVAEAAGAAAITGATPQAGTGYSPGNQYMIQIARTMVKRAVLACK
jgi:xanthine dehydrogenase YagS FAD-binding subunit